MITFFELLTSPNVRRWGWAALLLIIVFPDVLFRNASIIVSSNALLPGEPAISARGWQPERAGRVPLHGLADPAAAGLQSEPMSVWVARTLKNGESLSWNPFSGAGQMGPETLVDVKTSPVTLLAALLGGGLTALHIAWFLLLYVSLVALASWSLAQGFGPAAQLSVQIFFLLQGFSMANLASNVHHAYILFPLFLWAIDRWNRIGSNTSGLVVSGALALCWMSTFMPTLILFSVAAILMILFSSGSTSFKMKTTFFFVLGAALVSWIYFPILFSSGFLQTFQSYGTRVFEAAPTWAVANLLSPKHLFENYMAHDEVLFPGAQGARTFHFGFVAMGALVFASFQKNLRNDYVVRTGLVLILIGFGRVFGIPLVSHILNFIPLVKNIAAQYVFIFPAIGFLLVLPAVFQLLDRQRGHFGWFWGLPIFFVGLFLLWRQYGLPPESSSQVWYLNRQVAFRYVLVAISFGGFALMLSRHSFGKIRVWGLLSLMCVELIFAMNSVRPLRRDFFQNPPQWVQELRQEPGFFRVQNLGHSGLHPEFGSAWGILQTDSFTYNNIPTWRHFCSQFLIPKGADTQGTMFCVNRDPGLEWTLDSAAFRVAGVKWLLLDPAMVGYSSQIQGAGFVPIRQIGASTLWQTKQNPLRVYSVSNLRLAENFPNRDQIETVAYTDDPKFLRRWETGKFSAASSKACLKPQMAIEIYKNTEVMIRYCLPTKSVVVLSDNWAPGWSAFVDGQLVDSGRVNGSFRGAIVDAGAGSLLWQYTQPGSLWGTRISLAALGFWIFLLGFCFISNSRKMFLSRRIQSTVGP